MEIKHFTEKSQISIATLNMALPKANGIAKKIMVSHTKEYNDNNLHVADNIGETTPLVSMGWVKYLNIILNLFCDIEAGYS